MRMSQTRISPPELPEMTKGMPEAVWRGNHVLTMLDVCSLSSAISRRRPPAPLDRRSKIRTTPSPPPHATVAGDRSPHGAAARQVTARRRGSVSSVPLEPTPTLEGNDETHCSVLMSHTRMTGVVPLAMIHPSALPNAMTMLFPGSLSSGTPAHAATRWGGDEGTHAPRQMRKMPSLVPTTTRWLAMCSAASLTKKRPLS
mmetsp:Transcript_69433/g.163222  ORF Transcript_69433/g.163222 Transcript_69433/m.163222 type:complete len:200 (-) Transcript_69433:1672-2271(-)